MTYDPNFPQSNSLISQSPSGFQSNWEAIDSNTSGFSVDHVSLKDSTNGGRHKVVHLKMEAADPETVSDEGALYSKDVGASDKPDIELFFRREKGGLITQLTGLGSSLSDDGFYRFPGGLLVKWGKFTAGSGHMVRDWPTGPDIPVFSDIFQVFLQPTDTLLGGSPGSPSGYVYVNNFTTTQLGAYSTFLPRANSSEGNFSYLAIGS